MVECLADLIQFLVFLPVLIDLLLLRKALLRQLSNLHLVIAGIEELSFVLLDAHAEDFNLLRESFDLDGLEDDDELQVLSQVGLLVVGQVLDARPDSKHAYLRRSSPYASESFTIAVEIKERFTLPDPE